MSNILIYICAFVAGMIVSMLISNLKTISGEIDISYIKGMGYSIESIKWPDSTIEDIARAKKIVLIPNVKDIDDV